MTTQFRRLGDRRKIVRRQSNEIIDGATTTALSSFPNTNCEVLCGMCGQRYPALVFLGGNTIGVHTCAGKA